jgi:hypothetical protein
VKSAALTRAVLVLWLALACTPAVPSATSPSPPRPEPIGTATATATASPAPGAACPAVRSISLGAISGKFGYPAEGIPPLALIAMRADDPAVFRVVHTRQIPAGAQIPYTIAALEPATYVVVAYVAGGSAPSLAGAYTPAVACGLSATCTDHSLIRVTVRGGETVPSIDLLDWYAPPGTFPARPAASTPFRPGDALLLCNPYADAANMRASAGLGFPVRRVLDNGSRVVVRDGPLGADGYDWYEVNVTGDQLASGWVVAYALRK